jgi:hypothetical protein
MRSVRASRAFRALSPVAVSAVVMLTSVRATATPPISPCGRPNPKSERALIATVHRSWSASLLRGWTVERATGEMCLGDKAHVELVVRALRLSRLGVQYRARVPFHLENGASTPKLANEAQLLELFGNFPGHVRRVESDARIRRLLRYIEAVRASNETNVADSRAHEFRFGSRRGPEHVTVDLLRGSVESLDARGVEFIAEVIAWARAEGTPVELDEFQSRVEVRYASVSRRFGRTYLRLSANLGNECESCGSTLSLERSATGAWQLETVRYVSRESERRARVIPAAQRAVQRDLPRSRFSTCSTSGGGQSHRKQSEPFWTALVSLTCGARQRAVKVRVVIDSRGHPQATVDWSSVAP